MKCHASLLVAQDTNTDFNKYEKCEIKLSFDQYPSESIHLFAEKKPLK